MKIRSLLAGLPFCAFLLTSCSEKPPSPATVADLEFPIVLLFGNSATRVCKEPSELTNMHTNYLTLPEGTPMLIDSAFKIYSVERLRSVHNSLWLMANPSGTTGVTFDLRPQLAGHEAARALFARQLEEQIWLSDLDTRRELLANEQTLAGMAKLMERGSDER